MTNPFQVAYDTVENVEGLVADRITDAKDTADEMTALALSTFSQLQDINFNYSVGEAPDPPTLDSEIKLNITIPEIDPVQLGTVNSQLPTYPTLEDIPELDEVSIPTFTSSISSLTIPEPPAWTTPDDPPTEPTITDPTLPTSPTYSLPSPPSLDDVTVPIFAGVTLPTFDDTEPTFQASALPDVLQWEEPEYTTEILDEVLTQIRALWAGGSGIPAAIEQAMVERAMAREDMIATREIDAISNEFSLRGFTMPSGMQAARIDQMRQALAVKKMAANRELSIEFAKYQIENVRFGVEKAIAAENVLVNIHLNMAERLFQAAKYQVESQIQIYNAQVALFNAQMSAYDVRARVYHIQVQAALSEVEIFKAEVEAEIAKGQVNEQRVRAYTAQLQGVQTLIDVYKAQLAAAQTQVDISRGRIEMYGQSVRAYAERINADKVRFEAYEAQVRGEAAKANIIDSEARAYAALIQGKATIADIGVKQAQLSIDTNRMLLTGYAEEISAEKVRVETDLATIQAQAQAYIADTQRYVAQANATTATAQVEVSAREVEMRSNIAYYEARVNAYLGQMEQLIRQAQLIVEALKAAGQMSSTLAAGAMAGVHVGATLSGTGQVGASGAYSESYSESESTSTVTNINIEQSS